ncbi:oligoendopeptidase F [Marinilactibacillus psychrotolerans]|uniref:Oligopeptidase F n=1 Tax=Marinilactibacillus psychrotolerans TaxID=191770 RepID=A0AAV3WP90_9LACT|nr:oligoendopeptidase F [Marinilactibacillus psychrotolerans]GEL66041.1 oligoendopeptidase F [Marinilactibacillus psychrotolerans]GEQ34550.1 oligoendopeptidase F [Marinilactibacillus psychrotolerans]SDC00275.1 oligoendopeptidase F [Marinilactibacillus psychrotolerans]
MSEVKSLPKREEVSKELTWDLTVIFKSDQEWENAIKDAENKVQKISSLQGTLANRAEDFFEALESILDVYRSLGSVYVYSHLKNDQDTSNGTYQAMNDRARLLATKAGEATSWFEPELLSLSEDKLKGYFEEKKELTIYKHYIDQLTANREHVLSAEMEALLAGASDILTASSQTFSVLNNADLTFPKVKGEHGEEVQLSHGMYGQLLESTNREVREEAFQKMYEIYEGLKNTFASTLSANVKNHNYQASVHKFNSARERALSANHIPESVHETLVDVVNEHLPLLHRYMELRKKILNVSELHMYDLYTPITGEASLKYTYDEAKKETLKGLAPLGSEYKNVLEKAFNHRWIDVIENKGKRSGAYSSGDYDTNPYILLNWHDSLNHLYTLVHELGHSAHSYFTRDNQPFVYGDYSIFLAEIASTTNENILTDYLLKTTEDPKARAYVLNHYLDGFKGTVFRQTQFAEFEHFMHEEAAKGIPLTADYLSKNYAEINSKYYGKAVEKDTEIQYEWARIPHFYYNYYVYQYSTGFCAATALADNILNGKDDALEKYLNYLKAGSSDFPIEVMKKAGVDMTNKDYIVKAMKVFEARLNEFEDTLKDLNL